jgi:xanthine dehydrogenase accessory factor
MCLSPLPDNYNPLVSVSHRQNDVDPRACTDHCCTISDKALAIGGGVLEAILIHLRGKR